jgi:hypothetical protein
MHPSSLARTLPRPIIERLTSSSSRWSRRGLLSLALLFAVLASSVAPEPASAASPSIDVWEYAKNYLAIEGHGFTPGGPVVVRLIRPTGTVARTQSDVAWGGRVLIIVPMSSCEGGPGNVMTVEGIDVVTGMVDRLTAIGCHEIGVRSVA